MSSWLPLCILFRQIQMHMILALMAVVYDLSECNHYIPVHSIRFLVKEMCILSHQQLTTLDYSISLLFHIHI